MYKYLILFPCNWLGITPNSLKLERFITRNFTAWD